MGKVFLISLWVICFSCTQVLAKETLPSNLELESRQGFLGQQFGAQNFAGFSPAYTTQNNYPLLQQQHPYLYGLPNLGGFQGLAELQGLADLQSLAELQSLSGLQGGNGHGLQDSQGGFLRRFGQLGIGNGLRNNFFAPGTLGFGSPILQRLGGPNPFLRRGVGGQQESLQDLLALDKLLSGSEFDSKPSNSLQFSLNQQKQQQQPSSFTPLYTTETGTHRHSNQNEDDEVTALLQALNSLQSFPPNNRGLAVASAASLPPGVGVPRFSPIRQSPFIGRGGSVFPLGLFNSRLRQRTGLESDNTATVTNRVGIPADFNPPKTETNPFNRQEDVSTEPTDDFRFPFTG